MFGISIWALINVMYSIINILVNKGGSFYAENALIFYSFRQMMEK